MLRLVQILVQGPQQNLLPVGGKEVRVRMQENWLKGLKFVMLYLSVVNAAFN